VLAGSVDGRTGEHLQLRVHVLRRLRSRDVKPVPELCRRAGGASAARQAGNARVRRSVIAAGETFDGTWPFAPRFSDRAGFRMHYVDEGCGDPLVLLHGEPTWGYLYRRFIGPLAGSHRVVVPDHMGFGRSETPQDRSYLLTEHVGNVESLLVDELDLREITLVLHDWGGPIGAGFALRHPERIARIILLNSLLPLGLEHEWPLLAANMEESSWFRWVRSAHADGTLGEILGNARRTVAHLMLELQGIANARVVDPLWIRAYGESFAGPGESRGVIDFPRQVIAPHEFDPVHFPPPAAGAVNEIRGKPAMLAFGMLASHMIPIFEGTFPRAPVVRLESAAHFCQEDEPELLIALISQFVALTPTP
jgi:haloalkane dehalogenase